MAKAESTVTYRNCPGHVGYRVGDDGSVWSAKSHRGVPGGGTVSTVTDTWKPLKGCICPQGYRVVTLTVDGRVFTKNVHRLVLEAFVGPCPDGMECCHFDGDPANNALSNLRWDTRKGNADDRTRHGRTLQGEQHGGAILTPDLVRSIRSRYAEARRGRKKVPNGTLVAMSSEFGVSIPTLDAIVSRRLWKHI